MGERNGVGRIMGVKKREKRSSEVGGKEKKQ